MSIKFDLVPASFFFYSISMNAILSILVRSFVLSLLTFFLSFFLTPGYGRSTGVPSPRDARWTRGGWCCTWLQLPRAASSCTASHRRHGRRLPPCSSQTLVVVQFPLYETERRSIPSFLHFSQYFKIFPFEFCVIDLSVRLLVCSGLLDRGPHVLQPGRGRAVPRGRLDAAGPGHVHLLEHHVRENYLGAACAKVPAATSTTKIIAEPGSLKAGVAVALEFGDG